MKGLTSNKLKTLAIILMILDHIGYYFVNYISDKTFDVLRFCGRLAMPIFAFLLVQGFINTRNLKKYIYRLFIVATVFQLLLYILGIINQVYVKNYYIVINTYLNILYSFVICLLVLSFIDRKIISKNKILDILVRVVVVLCLASTYLLIDMELGFRVLFTVLGIYAAEKMLHNNKIKFEGYIILIFATLVMAVFTDYNNMIFNLPSILAIVPISMYNGQRGRKSNILKYFFYIFYPLHHVLLYITALLITHKVR